MENFKTKLKRAKVLVFDVDGVLTDGSITLLPTGEEMRTMNTKDGYALQLAIKKGHKILVITGGKSESVKLRLNRLGITDVYLGVSDKLTVFSDYLKTHQISVENVLYMGDDIPDYEVMKQVGIPTCPLDSVPEIKDICIYVSDKKGGKGCVRDIIEQVMKVQGTWEINPHVKSV